MPYIRQEQRKDLDEAIVRLHAKISNFSPDEIEGVLNYTITSLLDSVLVSANEPTWRYRLINRIVGMLECVKLEYYRRLAGPYEDKAILKNGDLDIYGRTTSE